MVVVVVVVAWCPAPCAVVVVRGLVVVDAGAVVVDPGAVVAVVGTVVGTVVVTAVETGGRLPTWRR
jgi:hypothetical protein